MSQDTIAIRSISLASLRRYFQLRGWRQLSTGNVATLWGFTEEEASVEVALPQNRSLPDADRLIDDAVRTLSQLDNKQVSSIIDDINSIGFDRLRTVIPNELVRFDSIELAVAGRFIQNARRLFSAAATTELTPAISFGRVAKEALQYSERCRFGHTFRGSFGFTIESPIEPNNEPSLPAIEQIAPFERRVVQRIARGLNAIKRAEEAENPSVIAESFETGFNANLCEVFINLIEDSSDKLKIEFDWSPEWRPPPDLVSFETYTVKPATLSIVREAADSLRRIESSRNHTVFGTVISLRSEHNPADLLDVSRPREIVIQGDTEKLKSIHVRITLPPEDYILAVEAHKSGRPVSINGLLERKGRRWVLSHTGPLHLHS